MITTGAIFALAAPAMARANADRVLPTRTTFATHHKIVTKNHKVTAKAKTGKASGTTPLYIHYPFPLGGSSSNPSVDDCASYMVDCTDEQMCSLWGANCDLVATPSPTDATPVEPAQIAAPQSDAPSAEAPAVDSSVSENSDDC